MTATLIGYARCSTDRQDLTAQRQELTELGVAPERIYMDRGMTGTNCTRPGLGQAMVAVRKGDTLVVPKLDRLARSVPDARYIADQLREKGVKLAPGRNIHDPEDPMDKIFSISWPPLLRRNGHCPDQGQAAGQAAQAFRKAAEGALPHARHRRALHRRSRRGLRCFQTHRLPDAHPCRRFLMTITLVPYSTARTVPFIAKSHRQFVRACSRDSR